MVIFFVLFKYLPHSVYIYLLLLLISHWETFLAFYTLLSLLSYQNIKTLLTPTPSLTFFQNKPIHAYCIYSSMQCTHFEENLLKEKITNMYACSNLISHNFKKIATITNIFKCQVHQFLFFCNISLEIMFFMMSLSILYRQG